MSNSQKSIGDQGEEYAANRLRSQGVNMVRRIPTRFVWPAGSGKPVYTEKAAGDIRGVLPDGTSVLAEVKTRTTSERLAWSDLSDHQPGNLDEHLETNGLSLLVFVSALGIIVMEWPIPGLSGPGDGIGEEEMLAREWEGVT